MAHRKGFKAPLGGLATAYTALFTCNSEVVPTRADRASAHFAIPNILGLFGLRANRANEK
jgi:hypothetical protein